MKNILLLLSVLFMINSSCNTQHQHAQDDMNTTFESLTVQLVHDFMTLNPTWALSIGLHTNDSTLEVLTPDLRKDKLNRYSTWADSLQSFPDDKLSMRNRMDKSMLLNYFNYFKWQSEIFKSHTWNPAEYNIGEGFDLVINNPDATLNQKLEYVLARLYRVPAYFDNAKKQLVNPTPEHTQLAITQNEGSKYIFQKILPDSIAKADISDIHKKKLQDAIQSALTEIDSYIAHLKQLQQSAQCTRNFRIGKTLFEQKFAFDIQSSYSAEEIYNIALKRKSEILDTMYTLAKGLWPKYFTGSMPSDTLTTIRALTDRLSDAHPHRDSLLQTIEKQIPQLEQFIHEKQLLYLDQKKPLVVRKTPPYMDGGGAGASINDPGPFNKNGKTYYNVSLLDKYDEQQAISYLREYNDYILQILNIHEAIPGHYTQLVYANQSPSLVKSIFGNGAMIEGWAVYGERMMLEEGYGQNAPELWLMYYKWHLRSVINTLLDYSIQCLGMSEAEAKRLMTREGFQQEAEAAGKWKRATLSQVQLCSYFTGYTEIYALREKLKAKQGKAFSLKAFHEEFLSYGSAPVPRIAEAMWNK
ncbi:MAG: DUF885 domain-containing protein [Bacteroidota bacterium]|jgi:hypothetical protein